MAAMNAAGMQRQMANVNGRPSASVGGVSPGSYIGGMSSSYNHPGGFTAGPPHDTTSSMQFNPTALSAQSNPQGIYPTQQTTNAPSNPSMNPSMSHPNFSASDVIKHRQRTFLTGLSQAHLTRAPLPPALTGVPYPPNYDPTTSPWKSLDCSPGQPGVVRLGGKDIDLLRLWHVVTQLGGFQKITQQQNGWLQVAHQFDLPEYLPHLSNPGQQRPVAHILGNLYNAILLPFDDMYRRNMQENNRKAMIAAGRQPGVNAGAPNVNTGPSAPHAALPPGTMGANAAGGMMGQHTVNNQNPTISPASQSLPLPQSPHLRQSSAPIFQSPAIPSSSDPTPNQASSQLNTVNSAPQLMRPPLDSSEPETQGTKRRLESEEAEGKRTRQKTDPPDTTETNNTTTPHGSVPGAPPSRTQFTRTKVEYIPLSREIDFTGGRDFNALEEDYVRSQRRPMRDINEWGTVDIEALTMSIRSRLNSELSYALTTMTLLSTMRGPTPGSGFPISQCTDLLEEVLDLLEEEAFGTTPDVADYRLGNGAEIVRHRALVDHVFEKESMLFAGLEIRDPQYETRGPGHRAGNVVLTVTNLIRNLSVTPDNIICLARHERTLDLVLRVCGITTSSDGTPKPTSPALALSDVINVRKDALHIFGNLSNYIAFPNPNSPSNATTVTASRILDIITSILIEPFDSVPPTQFLKQSGVPFPHSKPSSIADLALDVFTRLGQSDSNRQVFSRVMPQSLIWRLLESLVHRLPVSDLDFAFLGRDPWLSYLEKTIMAIYTIAFFSPPELKKKIKADRPLCFSQVMIRLVQRFVTMGGSPEVRQWHLAVARRAVEAMKVVDEEDDAFDTSQSTQTTLAFGMGFIDGNDPGIEKGIGLLAGRRDAAWELLMRDLDPVMFSELESLMRVEC
ncbi:hypothetical protein DEU56DRAFT_816192 [Suillus clintonianus]|uniref:uncharacterized protein n=1 Tax=Suillus clintonianus TaxID=1904413 RepID=UPI001B87213D|nr:uncharacterized protein DEU56DRAFT_816192 [Suillus clintonianus]KAG2129913.1 hypothetical protein DEU56DRAFT_816192 [Suillus clintonianus]